MLRYKLRTLLILMAILPPLLWFGWTKYETWQERKAQQARITAIVLGLDIDASQFFMFFQQPNSTPPETTLPTDQTPEEPRE